MKKDFNSMLDEIINSNEAIKRENDFMVLNKSKILIPFFEELWDLFEVINERSTHKVYFNQKEFQIRQISENGNLRMRVSFFGNFGRYFHFRVNDDYKPTLTINDDLSYCNGITTIGIDDSIKRILSFIKTNKLIK